MKQMQWIKTRVGLFDDPKVRYMLRQPNGDSYFAVWCMLKDLAGMINDHGRIYLSTKQMMTTELLARHLGRRRTFMEKALALYEQLDLVGRDSSGMIRILTWEEDQDYDRVQRRREATRKRVAAYRERQAETEPAATTENAAVEVPQDGTDDAETVSAVPDNSVYGSESVTYYQKCFRFVSSAAAQELFRLERERGSDAVCDAIEKACQRGKPHVNYIKGILRNRPAYTKEERDNAYGWPPAVVRKLDQLFPETGGTDQQQMDGDSQ